MLILDAICLWLAWRYRNQTYCFICGEIHDRPVHPRTVIVHDWRE